MADRDEDSMCTRSFSNSSTTNPPSLVSDPNDREDEETEQKLINEEYKTWKKNAPFLYDMILSTALDWPTLTTQWLPDKQSQPDKPFSTHRLLIGTHTAKTTSSK